MKMRFPIRARYLKKTLAVAVVGVFFGGHAHAINVLQAYEAALKNDPTYRMAVHERDAGRENKILGRAGLLPSVSAQYNASKVHADIEGTNVIGQPTLTHPQYISRIANVQLRQSLFNLDAYARYKQGVAQSQASESYFDARTNEVAMRVVSAYLDALLAAEQVALARAQRDSIDEQRKVNDRMFARGEGTKTDMLETQARLDVAEANLLEALDNEAATRATLAGVIGREVDVLEGVGTAFKPQPISPNNLESWRELALKNNAELVSQTFAVEAARQEINKQRAGHAPRLDFVSSYSKNASETLNTRGEESTVRSIGVQLIVPLYAGGAVNAATRQAVANYERAKADQDARTDKVLIEVRKQFNAVNTSSTRIAALDKATESSKLLIKATEQSIKGGVRINLDLLNAQQQLYTSQRDLAQARFNYLLAKLRLRSSAGTLGYSDVQEVAAYFR
jgi:outer membrane protein, protease secretion system